MIARLRHGLLTLAALPGLIFSPQRRTLFREMQMFCQNLPAALRSPLPEALGRLTPAMGSGCTRDIENTIRDLADVAALLNRRSPPGLCLRRSLVRYHFLRREGLPVTLQFGAKFVAGKPDREVTGHAWLALDGQPYHEADENWRGFAIMFSFPNPNSSP